MHPLFSFWIHYACLNPRQFLVITPGCVCTEISMCSAHANTQSWASQISRCLQKDWLTPPATWPSSNMAWWVCHRHEGKERAALQPWIGLHSIPPIPSPGELEWIPWCYQCCETQHGELEGLLWSLRAQDAQPWGSWVAQVNGLPTFPNPHEQTLPGMITSPWQRSCSSRALRPLHRDVFSLHLHVAAEDTLFSCIWFLTLLFLLVKKNSTWCWGERSTGNGN